MKRVILLGGLIALAIGLLESAGCANNSMSGPYGSNGTPSPSSPNTFVLQNLSFNPASMTVPIGTTITWQNSDGITHTSTSDSPGLWDTGNIGPGASKTTTFNTAGTFTFHCTYHRSMGMAGTITVR